MASQLSHIIPYCALFYGRFSIFYSVEHILIDYLESVLPLPNHSRIDHFLSFWLLDSFLVTRLIASNENLC